MVEPATEAIRTTGSTQAGTNELSVLVIALLKRVVYQEEDAHLWNQLLKLQSRVRDYVAVLGMELTLDEAEGYAFLRSTIRQEEDDSVSPTPRLIARRQLSFPVSLLLALFRKKLAEFDARGGDTRLVLSREDIVDIVRVFLPDGSNETRLINQVDAHINKIVDLGFLRRMKAQSSREDLFEVRRILKAFVDAQWLSEFDARLAQYQQQVAGLASEANDD